jgi:nicotinate phosphoribosyltransferase
MDIVEVEGEPRSKKGKMLGKKSLYRCWNCFKDYMVLSRVKVDNCPRCGSKVEEMLKPIVLKGKVVYEEKSPKEVREYVLKQLSLVEELKPAPPP